MSMPEPEDFSQVAHVYYAGFWLRFVAYIIDYFIVGIASYTIFFGIAFANVPDLIGGTIIAFTFIAGNWLYYALMESSDKQATLGKMAIGLKVTDENGRQVSFGKATGRYFGKIISRLVLYIGYIMAAFTAKKQALHDIMSGCLVLKN